MYLQNEMLISVFVIEILQYENKNVQRLSEISLRGKSVRLGGENDDVIDVIFKRWLRLAHFEETSHNKPMRRLERNCHKFHLGHNYQNQMIAILKTNCAIYLFSRQVVKQPSYGGKSEWKVMLACTVVGGMKKYLYRCHCVNLKIHFH